MNEQNIPQLNESVQNSKHIWITAISVVITAIVVGSGVYTWQKSSLRATEQSLQQQMSNLQDQVTNLQKSTQPVVITPEETQAPTQPADETANRQTYINANYGFEVKYPKGWFAYERAGEKRVYIQTVPGEVSKGIAPVDFRRIWIAYDSEEANENPSGLTGAKKYSVINNGITMNYYEWPPNLDNGEPTIEAYWVNSNGYRYMADCASEVGHDNSEQEIIVLKQILSTFKFTK